MVEYYHHFFVALAKGRQGLFARHVRDVAAMPKRHMVEAASADALAVSTHPLLVLFTLSTLGKLCALFVPCRVHTWALVLFAHHADVGGRFLFRRRRAWRRDRPWSHARWKPLRLVRGQAEQQGYC